MADNAIKEAHELTQKLDLNSLLCDCPKRKVNNNRNQTIQNLFSVLKGRKSCKLLVINTQLNIEDQNN